MSGHVWLVPCLFLAWRRGVYPVLSDKVLRYCCSIAIVRIFRVCGSGLGCRSVVNVLLQSRAGPARSAGSVHRGVGAAPAVTGFMISAADIRPGAYSSVNGAEKGLSLLERAAENTYSVYYEICTSVVLKIDNHEPWSFEII